MKNAKLVLTDLGRKANAPFVSYFGGALLFITGTAAMAASYPDAVLAEGPIAYYRFNDVPPVATNSGSLGPAVSGAYNNTATAGAEAPRPPTFPGFEADNTALQLDGAGAFVSTIAGLMNDRPVFTICGWSRRNIDQRPRTGLWGQNDLVEIGYINNTTLQAWTDDELNVAPNPFPNGEWGFLAVVSDGSPGTISIYTNGVLAASREHFIPENNDFGFNIGGGGVFDGDLNLNFFNGQIDEVAIFDKALPSERISFLYLRATGTPAALSISRGLSANSLILSWPTNATGFALQSTPNLTPPVTWLDVTNPPTLFGGMLTLTNPMSGPALFFQLRKAN